MNEAKIHNLFPVPVFHYKLENYQETNQELLNYILELQKKDKIGNSHSNKGGWHSPNFDIVNEGPPVKFINKIKDYLKDIIFANEQEVLSLIDAKNFNEVVSFGKKLG